jgi:hypothetical protein
MRRGVGTHRRKRPLKSGTQPAGFGRIEGLGVRVLGLACGLCVSQKVEPEAILDYKEQEIV